MAILPENEYTEFENREYINPQVSLDEQMSFIDNLRQTQQANNQQIKTDTYNLGTAVPSNLGGLVGGEGYWTSRYQTPQTNSLVNDLRATAQASALNQILQNEQAKWANRYNKARNANAIRNKNNGAGDDETPDQTTEGGYEEEDSTVYEIDGKVPGVVGGHTVAQIDTDSGTILGYTGVPYGQDGKINYNSNDKDYVDNRDKDQVQATIKKLNDVYRPVAWSLFPWLQLVDKVDQTPVVKSYNGGGGR